MNIVNSDLRKLVEDTDSAKLSFKDYGYVSNGIKTGNQLLDFELTDFIPFHHIELRNLLEIKGFNSIIYISGESLKRDLHQNEIEFTTHIELNVFDWGKDFTANEYLSSIQSVWNDHGNSEYIRIESLDEDFEIYFVFTTDIVNKTLNQITNQAIMQVTTAHKEAISKLITNTLNIQFNFPNDIQVACKQYLIYFVDFLKDFGINSNSNIGQDSGKTLFSIKPTDSSQALENIREALAIYLSLPASPIVYDESFEAMRLRQQIENLQHSQKMAARELQLAEKVLVAQSDTIQDKNTIISQKGSTIEHQNKIIEMITSKSIMMDSLENKEEYEEIYDGVRVGESKWLKDLAGIALNPAKAIKTAVKNTLGKDDGNSILDVDEKEDN